MKAPADCYLVAWLFVRQVHLHISRVIDDNASPLFVVKYLRSYFLEDWELVSKLLDLFHWRQTSNQAILEHLQRRLELFSQKFTRTEYDAYRNGVIEEHRRGEHNFEFLPGLLREIDIVDCHAIAQNLWKANFQEFAPENPGDVGDRIHSALIALQNRQGYIAVHQGDYQVEAKGDQLYLSSGSETLVMNICDGDGVSRQTCRVSFHLSCAGEILQRIARVHAKEGITTAWLGGGAAGAYAGLFGPLGTFEQSENAQAYVESRLVYLRKIYQTEFGTAIKEGCIAGRTIFLDWLGTQQGFYCSLIALSELLGNEVPPRSTFRKLFGDFFSKEGLDLLVRHSLVYGVGYNVGEVSRGEARERMRRGAIFDPEIGAIYKIRDATGFDSFNFFYQEDEGAKYPLPRYYF